MWPQRSVTSSADFVATGFRAEKAKVRHPGVYKSFLIKVIYSFLLRFRGVTFPWSLLILHQAVPSFSLLLEQNFTKQPGQEERKGFDTRDVVIGL